MVLSDPIYLVLSDPVYGIQVPFKKSTDGYKCPVLKMEIPKSDKTVVALLYWLIAVGKSLRPVNTAFLTNY